jgi:hypothetical protein
VTLWIRIRVGNPDADPDPGARKLRNFSGKMHFLVIFQKIIHQYFLFDLTQISISKKFEKEIVCESSVLAWIRVVT